MSSLFALLSQQTPNLQTRKGLILTGLQHDFLSREGKLPVSVDNAFTDRVNELVTEFRQYGDVIWVRSEFEATREPSALDEEGCNVITSPGKLVAEIVAEDEASEPESSKPSRKRKAGARSASDTSASVGRGPKQSRQEPSDHASIPEDGSEIDEELFLTKTSTREPCCVKGTVGADFADTVKPLIQGRDLQVVKSYYSAFSSTSLLLTLRSKLITELFIGGCMTNMSVYATAMDAARYGIKVVLIQDCLGYRTLERHNLAIRRLVDIMGARVTTSQKLIERFRNRSNSDDDEDESEEDGSIKFGEDARQLQAMHALDADSNDEDEDFIPTVRSSLPSHRPLELRQKTADLPGVTATSKRRSPVEHSESARAPSSDHRRSLEGRKANCSEGKEKQSGCAQSEEERGLNPSGSAYCIRNGRKQPGMASSVETAPPPNVTSPSPSASMSNHRGAPNAVTVEKDARTKRKAKWRAVPGIIERPSSLPLFGEDKEAESAGSRILYDLLPPNRVDGLFQRLNDEVRWQSMRHQTGEVPRMVCCQGTIEEDGSMPVYRHPADETIALLEWTSAVDEIRRAAESVAGHELNHALIQLYRGGVDFISEHSDKTIDVVPGSNIVNVSYGAERTMRLRTKRAIDNTVSSNTNISAATRTTYRIRMPHNSALIMSLDTNAEYLHGINADKRRAAELSAAEKAYSGQRISLTFRQIGTFINSDSSLIWGHGAVGKVKEVARRTINGDEVETEKLVRAFGLENQASRVQWAECYGEGSDVLHLK